MYLHDEVAMLPHDAVDVVSSAEQVAQEAQGLHHHRSVALRHEVEQLFSTQVRQDTFLRATQSNLTSFFFYNLK